MSSVRGAIYDVIIDLRPASPTHGCWRGFDLSAENRLRLYIPAGYAHGFQTLTDDAEVEYLISEFHTPDRAAGVRYDDAAVTMMQHFRSPGRFPSVQSRIGTEPGRTTSRGLDRR